MANIRIGTFNVENLFGRAKVLNFHNHENGDEILRLVAELQSELEQAVYNKPRIASLYDAVEEFVKFNVIRSEIGHRIVQRRDGELTVRANGRSDWIGFLEFRRDSFDDTTQKNTARVIQEIDADILGLIEVEDRLVMKYFNSERLRRRYNYNVLIDGNDNRGIDVGVYSKIPFEDVRTNIFDGPPTSRTFSRDCLEVDFPLDGGGRLHVLTNHFKSKSGRDQARNNRRRQRQANRVAEIIAARYDLTRDLVAILGDLNDTPQSTPLAHLLDNPHLHDALALQFDDPADRWTYHYRRNEQIDYILVSEPLRRAFTRAGVERRGIAELAEYTRGAEQPYSTVTSWRNAASDHAAIWADFNL